MRFSYAILAVLILGGCYDAPPGTRHMNAQEIEVAEIVADYFDVPEECRHYDDVGIYQAVSQEDFFYATDLGAGGAGLCATEAPGECPNSDAPLARARTIHSVNPPWEDLIVLDTHFDEETGEYEGAHTMTFAHEMLHVFRVCQYGVVDGSGHNEQFPEIEDYFWHLVITRQQPEHMTFDRPEVVSAP